MEINIHEREHVCRPELDWDTSTESFSRSGGVRLTLDASIFPTAERS
jgi:hypothetical protein